MAYKKEQRMDLYNKAGELLEQCNHRGNHVQVAHSQGWEGGPLKNAMYKDQLYDEAQRLMNRWRDANGLPRRGIAAHQPAGAKE